MEENWEGRPSYEPKPHTYSIALAMIVGAATFSYLGCVALIGALQKQGVIDPFPKGHDPRLRWFLLSFAALTALCFGIFGLVRLLGHRKLDEDELPIDEVTPMKRDVPTPIQTPDAPEAPNAPKAPK